MAAQPTNDSSPEVTLTAEPPDGPTARRLIEALCAELQERYGTPPSPFSAADATAPRSVFLVARVSDEAVGCGALRRFDDEMGELKRMYVAPAGRRRGIARRIVAELERRAIEFGYGSVRLETGLGQPDAIQFYESCGYQRIDAFGPYVGNPVSVCFEKRFENR